MDCNQCGNDMSRQTQIVSATPDAEHVFWCSRCGTVARVAPGETPAGRVRTTWLLPVEVGTTKKDESVTSATRELANILSLNCSVLEDELVDILKRVVDERLREIFGDIDAPV